MSLVHLMRVPIPNEANVSVSARVTASDSRNCSATGRNCGSSTSEKVRFSPSGLVQVWPRWPRPAVWRSAQTMSPWRYSGFRASSLVEVVSSMRQIMGGDSYVGRYLFRSFRAGRARRGRMRRQADTPKSRRASLSEVFLSVDSLRRPMIRAHATSYSPAGNRLR